MNPKRETWYEDVLDLIEAARAALAQVDDSSYSVSSPGVLGKPLREQLRSALAKFEKGNPE